MCSLVIVSSVKEKAEGFRDGISRLMMKYDVGVLFAIIRPCRRCEWNIKALL